MLDWLPSVILFGMVYRTVWGANCACILSSFDNTTLRGYEHLRAEPNGFLVHHLSHSVTVSCYQNGPPNRQEQPPLSLSVFRILGQGLEPSDPSHCRCWLGNLFKSYSGYSSVGRASDCRFRQRSDGPWFDSGWPDIPCLATPCGQRSLPEV